MVRSWGGCVREGGTMIWALLALLGVPLWLCAGGLSVLVMRNHAIRRTTPET